MGLLQYQHTMVAAKLLISLCVAGLTAGAPQSQQAIVGNVVTALQPSIARAVAEALRGLGGSRSSGSSPSGSSFSSAGATGAVRAAAEIDPLPYAFEYKIADDEAQAYISQKEARDGDDIIGTYSYVDPNGDLITVNYRAGLDGFSQTMEKQVGAVEIRPKKATSSQIASTSSTTGSRATSSFGGRSSTSRGSFSSRSSSSSSSAGINQSDLIAQILSVLQPQISAAVNTAFASQ